MSFEPPPSAIERFGLAEAVVRLDAPPAGNPFQSVRLVATLVGPGGSERRVAGFCDDPEGCVHRVRFMPIELGQHRFRLWVEALGDCREWSGSFVAEPGGCPGMLEPHGWHFRWSGTREPFTWQSTTAYLMAGLSEARMEEAVDRLAGLGVNRIRVAICPSRQMDGGRWYEPQVREREDFTFRYGPWPAERAWDALNPGYDVARFDTAYWQKLERLIARARARRMIVQAIFLMDAQEPQNYPFDLARLGDDPDERRYYDYAVARLAAFSNVEWCVTNEWALYRPDEWVEAVGSRLAEIDPYGHALSVHGHGHFPFRSSPWCTHALYQCWDEHGGHGFMLANRREQEALGRPLPQVNEEYGYEDHYSPWGENRKPPARSAESRLRLAWEIAFAGAYQTTGDSAANGLGGWINGLGDESMTMLEGYRRLGSFFEAFDFGATEPADDLVSGHAHCLAEPGRQYAVYVYAGGCTALELPDDGPWVVRGYDPRTGRWTPPRQIPRVEGRWASPHVPYGKTRAYLLTRRQPGSKR